MNPAVKNNVNQDHYKASIESGELFMQPFCACGNPLNEDYFCEKCSRRCRCYLIVCKDQAALELVQFYIRHSAQFSGYSAQLTVSSP